MLTSAAMGFHELSKQPVKDASELSVISGHMSSYSFQDGARGHHHYVIQLFEYPATFQIPADFLGSFRKDRFQSDLRSGSSVSVSIPKGNEKRLTLDERIFVLSVRTQTVTYLDEKDTLRAYNSGFPVWTCAVFFLIGSGSIIWTLKHTPKSLQASATAPSVLTRP